ncbi:MAG: hypothetical protein SF097_02390 [Acidobacteriota bacterium]|nr:hypothetical protein [Acidobacteriota bacterium]
MLRADSMIAPETVAEIRRLFYAEHWKIGTIAAALCLHADTVKHALRAVVPVVRTPKPRVLEPYEALVRETLQRHPRLRATRLLEMLRDRGFTGSIHQLRRGVKALRPATREAFFRLTTLPGEQAQVDWASFGWIQVGQARRQLACFVMTLSYSRAALLEQKRKALGATASGRLAHAVPDIATFLDAAFQRGESPARQTTQLLLLLDDYGAPALADAVREALAQNTPRAASVAFILSRRGRGSRAPLPVDLSRAPHLADLSIPTQNLEAYDQLTQTRPEDRAAKTPDDTDARDEPAA